MAAYHDGSPIFPLKRGVNPGARKGTNLRGMLAQSIKSEWLLRASQTSFSPSLAEGFDKSSTTHAVFLRAYNNRRYFIDSMNLFQLEFI
jgi:hypothetical protein